MRSFHNDSTLYKDYELSHKRYNNLSLSHLYFLSFLSQCCLLKKRETSFIDTSNNK